MSPITDIDSRRWMRNPGRVSLFDGTYLCFEEMKGNGFKVAARVAVEREGAVLAEVTTSDVGSTWLPGRLRRGLHLATSFGAVSLVRNGPRPLRSQRTIRLNADGMSWTLKGRTRGFEFINGSEVLVWSRSGRLELLEMGQSAESLALVGILAYANVPAALAAFPVLSGR